MLKNIALITLLVSGISFAQKSETQKNKLLGNPTFVEESMQKANIRMSQIVNYELEYYTKSNYNSEGNPTKREYFNETGERTFSESFNYNEAGKIISREMKSEDESLVFNFDYEYTTEDYNITKSENDVNVSKTTYKLDNNQNIIYEKEINLLEDNEVFVEKKYDYQNDFLVKTSVKYNQGSYTLDYKNDAKGNPTEELYIDKNNKLINKYIRKFDTNNNIIEESTFGADGKLTNVSTIKYQYDDKKNWTKRTQYASKIDQPISNTTRTIRY